jgi:hypothetical protein
MSGVALGFVKRESGNVNGLHSTSANPRSWSSQPMLLDLDDAKEQFLHSYPLLTVNIEAPFAGNVKVIMRMLRVSSIFNAIYYHRRCDLLA